ncbi:hypothetical protein [Roseimaritima ulvae]|uniref:MucB/RseB N-terminal domain-containing protein n=2 Tax=Roseimaritima ulvae TaxID=980254 RepID=A0A5B9QPL8_9BACT|nr:hypothetical protein [Roseimaritima ulvae]QEG38966.1 hypothetical protein UC8_09270 [Roseimaritima ulvae]
MMKYLFVLPLLLLMASVSWAIESEAGDKVETLQKSVQKWERMRERANGNYSYHVVTSSFSGFRSVTEIVVRENQVSERRYRETNRNAPRPDGAQDNTEYKWVEQADQLGTHQQGAPAKTLDQLYQQAAEILKQERPEHEKLYLRFDKQGLLQACFTVDTRIADDAPLNGVRIRDLQLRYKSPNGKLFPASWGAPPLIQTRDLRPLPGGYGQGSGTLARWIEEHLQGDKH